MRRSAGIRKIYLAGPEVFLSDARDIGDRKKSICESYGFEGIFPLDRLPGSQVRDPRDIARQIFEICVEMMDDSDMIVANMTPFRGVSMDAGTALELGYMYAHGKPAFGYTSTVLDYDRRVIAAGFTEDDQLVEDYGLSDNLMCEGVIRWPRESSLKRFESRIIRQTVSEDQLLSSLDGFDAAVSLARKCANENSVRL